MGVQKFFVQRIPLLLNSGSLISLAFVLAGVFIAIEGALKLSNLYTELSAYFPLNLPAKAGEKILNSLPFITKNFVMLVSSICSMIIGILWFGSGLFEAFQSRGRTVTPSEFANPNLCAEALRTSEPVHWASKPIFFRLLTLIWPNSRFMSPATYELLGRVLVSLVSVFAAMIITYAVVYVLQALPIVALKYFGANITIHVPSVSGLNYLFLFAAILNVAIGVSLIPMKKGTFERAGRELKITGQGDPHLFFALMEEGCRLLNAKRLPERRPIRLEQGDDPHIKGSLIESYPTLLTTMSRPMGYFCLPVIIILFIMGFSRLIQFDIPAEPLTWQNFLTTLLPVIIYKITLAFAIVIIGLHFAEWARKLLGICKFQSSVVFCKVKGQDHVSDGQKEKQPEKIIARRTGSVDKIAWKASHGVDSEFIDWAKDPDSARSFDIEVYWAEVISESATPDSSRYINIMRRTSALDAIMIRVLQLPFKARLLAQSAQPIIPSGRIQAQITRKTTPKEHPIGSETTREAVSPDNQDK